MILNIFSFNNILNFRYHSAPESQDNEHVYERTNHHYLELIEIEQTRHYSDTKDDEDNVHNIENDDYEEIE